MRWGRLLIPLAVIATALVAASAPNAGPATSLSSVKCKPGLKKVSGTWWVQYCGPASANVRFSGKTMQFVSGSCKVQRGILLLYIGKRVFRGTSSKSKYFELIAAAKGDGVYRSDASIEWLAGKTHYIVGSLKVVFRGGQKRGTFSGRLVAGGKGAASGSFKC